MAHKTLALVMIAGMLWGSVRGVGASPSRQLADLRAKEQELLKRYAECTQLQKTMETRGTQGPGNGPAAPAPTAGQTQALRCDDLLKNLAVNRQMQDRVLNQR